MPTHWMNLWSRPVAGTDFFIKRYPMYQYRHKISGTGGFDSASCVLDVSPAEAQQFFENLKCNVRVYVDNPAQRVFDGFINRVTLQIGNIIYTSSLDEVANRACAVYTAPDVATAPQVTTSANNDDSQAVYEIKEGILDGYLVEGSAVTKFTALRSSVLATRSWPQKSITYASGNGQNGLLQIEILGWYHMLNWVKYYEIAATGATNADALISAVWATYPNTRAFAVADARFIEANGSFSQSARSRTGQTYWEWFQSIQEAGDGSNKWVMGMTNPDVYGQTLRRLYYRPASTDIEYVIRSTDPKVRNVYGQYIEPWSVQPDRGVRVADILTGWNGIGDDPATFYIESVEYDADAQSVTFASTDNISLEGVFNLQNYFKTHKRFGVQIRQTWS